ncbi:MAG: hypothetical protein AYK22_02110 [Thermoplasmatales archaeon SG8-52-3]|nr:MAG: hypothetical protein AYK22_02110 [Thermoplasmatales archaeon SG8-52-3]
MKKIIGIFIFILLTTTILPITAIAGDEENPEISDEMGDAFGNIDINSVWFSEKSEEPDFLFVHLKINNPRQNKLQQTFAVFWENNGIQYACGYFIGLHMIGLELWTAGEYIKKASGGGPNYVEIDKGTYDTSTGIIKWKIPKEIIGNPDSGEVLTKTWSNAFQRYGLLGLIGFTRPIIDSLFNLVFKNSLWDYAPNNEDYGLDYIVQY